MSVPAPVSLRVDSIGVSEPIITLGLTDQGAAEVPTDYARAGWFSGGGRPGTIGPTVILGHVDSKTGPAVFFRLRELQVGAEVRLGLADGSNATYAITAVDSYSKDDFPTFAVYGATPRDVVRLVTCGGEFDRAAGSYTDNIVVTADRIA
ncbi:class F sortase [Nakamurella sp. A5-74]|uniref:Class F sortase n=1 Tax=Nakamurella sp. A5-74 TaxID=3158264 RepID=A0AAU8DMW0_9ACTN